MEQSNRWAAQLNTELDERRARVSELQDELARDQETARTNAEAYESKIRDLEADIQSKIDWAKQVEKNLTAEVDKQTAELVKAVAALHHTEEELQDRTKWALRLQEEAAELGRQVELFRASRWIKFGRKVGLGPPDA
jgi:thiamine monophosphate synthase